MRIAIVSRYVALSVLVNLLVGYQTLGAQASGDMLAESKRIVSQYKTRMEQPPTHIPSRDTVDGPLLGNGDLGAVIGGKPEAQCFWISKNNFWRLKDGHGQGGPRPFGTLELSIPALEGATYLAEQDIYPAITTSLFTKGNTNVTMRSYIAATADFLIIELSVTGGPVDVEAKVSAVPGRGATHEAGIKASIPWATKTFFNHESWVYQVTPTSAACAVKLLGADGPAFRLEPGQTVIVAMAMQSSFDAEEPFDTALAMAEKLSIEDVHTLEVQHRKWWSEFWAESTIEIGDPFLEKTFYMANYTLGSALRDPEFPTGLFGLWVTSDSPRWSGDYHLNFDYQSQFYGLYKANHLEQADTYHAPILAFMDRGRWYAKEILNIRGVYYCVGIGAKGIDTCKRGGKTDTYYQKGGCFMGQKCNAAYSAIPMAMHWYHTYDKGYGRTVYPFVLEVANFWEDYLRFEPFSPGEDEPSPAFAPTNAATLPPVCTIDGVAIDAIPVADLPPGRYVIYNDAIQEGPSCDLDINSVLGLGLVHSAFMLALDMSKELGVDADRREKWQHIVTHLSKFPTFEKDGVTVFRYAEKGTEWIDGNSVGLQHIYPSGGVGLDDDPKLLEIARNTINAAGRKWFNDNGENSHYPSAVRVGYDPETILEKLTMLWSTSRKWPNGLQDTVEQCSTVPVTLTEMLCMSHRQVLRVFPVWPRDRDARFCDLRAEGAFLVSSELKGGQVQFVRIHSEKGRDCTVVNPWPGKKMVVYRGGEKSETLAGARFVLKTNAGETIELHAL